MALGQPDLRFLHGLQNGQIWRKKYCFRSRDNPWGWSLGGSTAGGRTAGFFSRRSAGLFEIKFTRFLSGKSKMVVLFYVWKLDEVMIQKCWPIVYWHNDYSIVCPDVLGLVDSSYVWGLDHSGKFVPWRNTANLVGSFNDCKTTSGSELRMTSDKKWIINWFMKVI